MFQIDQDDVDKKVFATTLQLRTILSIFICMCLWHPFV